MCSRILTYVPAITATQFCTKLQKKSQPLYGCKCNYPKSSRQMQICKDGKPSNNTLTHVCMYTQSPISGDARRDCIISGIELNQATMRIYLSVCGCCVWLNVTPFGVCVYLMGCH